jgi:nucleoid DNA-binding protein
MIRKVGLSFVVRETAKRMNCSQRDALEMLQHFSDIVAEQVACGQSVGFKPLGVFAPGIMRKSHRKTIRFRPSTTLRRKMVDIRTGGDASAC